MRLVDAHAEYAQFGHGGHYLAGDQRIGQVPVVGVGSDALVGELTELLAHHVQHLVAERLVRAPVIGQQRGQRGAVGGGVAFAPEPAHGAVLPQGVGGVLRLQVGWAHHLVLAHGQAAQQLRQVFAEADPQHQGLPRCRAGHWWPGVPPRRPTAPAPPR